MIRTGLISCCGILLALPLMASAGIAQECAPEDFKFLASDGTASDLFGVSVALFNNDAIIGSFSGEAAYLFNALDGTEYRKLTSSDLGVEGFGRSVASTGFNVYVGAPRSTSPSGVAFAGTAFMFSAWNGAQVVRYDANDGGAADQFGSSIVVSGSTVAIGAPYIGLDNFGAVYLFDRTSGFQTAKLTASNGLAFDQMGYSLAIDGTTLVAGAPRHQSETEIAGAAFVFDVSSETQVLSLFNDGTLGDRFGFSVAIGGGFILVGAPFDDTVTINSGAVYIFDQATGSLIQKFLPPTTNHLAANERLGHSISINGTRALIGGPGVQDIALLLDLTTMEVIAELEPSDPNDPQNLFFGVSVAMSSSAIVVGATQDDDLGILSGSAYRFDPNPTSCLADLTNDCALNFFDVSAFLTAFGSNDPAADFNDDGNFNFFDVSAFLVAFNAGCP